MDSLLQFLKFTLLVSFPQAFVMWVFCFSFIEPKPNRLYCKIFLLTIVHSVYTDAFVSWLPLKIHLLNSIAAALILTLLIFKEFTLRKRLLILLFVYLVGFIMDILASVFAFYFTNLSSREEMYDKYLLSMMGIYYPLFVVLLVVAWMINKRSYLATKSALASLLRGEKMAFANVIILISIQFLLLGALQLFQITSENINPTLKAALIYVLIVVSLLALIFMIRLLIRSREQAARMTQEVYVEEINDMFTSIRGQRHDFLNHVQVIHTMAQMGKTEQLKNYVEDLVMETRDVSDIVHHTSPALAAIAQSKTTVALGKGIAFACELPVDWSPQETTVKVIDMIKILGNLVDNAFDESEKLSMEHRHVTVSIRAGEDRRIELVVSNNGRPIAGQDKSRFFDSGYSTKGEGHSGLGLAIVQERVKHYNGELHFTSEPSGNDHATTSFRILLRYSEG
ncbi:sensor histidine kinase [Cohnella soli]|uniref:Sensor histidine kinase n=1 Tax=Cohnella soli TaxID=425005 RepID=A0ABW0HP82_9BACL